MKKVHGRLRHVVQEHHTGRAWAHGSTPAGHTYVPARMRLYTCGAALRRRSGQQGQGGPHRSPWARIMHGMVVQGATCGQSRHAEGRADSAGHAGLGPCASCANACVGRRAWSQDGGRRSHDGARLRCGGALEGRVAAEHLEDQHAECPPERAACAMCGPRKPYNCKSYSTLTLM